MIPLLVSTALSAEYCSLYGVQYVSPLKLYSRAGRRGAARHTARTRQPRVPGSRWGSAPCRLVCADTTLVYPLSPTSLFGSRSHPATCLGGVRRGRFSAPCCLFRTRGASTRWPPAQRAAPHERRPPTGGACQSERRGTQGGAEPRDRHIAAAVTASFAAASAAWAAARASFAFAADAIASAAWPKGVTVCHGM